MDADRQLESLIKNEIVTESGDNGALGITEQFEQEVEQILEDLGTINQGSLEKLVGKRDSLRAPMFLDVFMKLGMGQRSTNPNRILAAEWVAIEDFAGETLDVDAVRTLVVVDQIRRGFPRTAGTPSGFLAVRGDQLPFVSYASQYSIVYIWKFDCQPCDTMCEVFDNVFGNGQTPLGTFSVFGPDWQEHLEKEYEVVGAPTTLFMIRNEVDVRLQGAHHESVVENESQILRELSEST